MREAVPHCQEANTLHQLDTELIVTPMIHGSTFELHKSSPIVLSVCEGDGTVGCCFRRLIRFHSVHVFAFTFAFLVDIAFLRVPVITCGIVVHSSTWSPAVFRPMSSSATVLARVVVCRARVGRAARAISSPVLVLTFAFSRTFLERVNFHPVIICTRSISRWLHEELCCWHMYPTADCF